MNCNLIQEQTGPNIAIYSDMNTPLDAAQNRLNIALLQDTGKHEDQ